MNIDDNYIFDDYFDEINLNDDLKRFYELVNDDDLQETFVDETYLTDLRNSNYKKYIEIDITQISSLSEEFSSLVIEIKRLYSFIDLDEILTCTKEKAEEHKKILDSLSIYITQFYDALKQNLMRLEKENDERQNKIKQINYNSVDKVTLHEILNNYNNLVIYNSVIEDNIYDNYMRQVKRKKEINKIYRMINLEIENFSYSENEKKELNEKILDEINKIKDKIYYLEDLMMEKSKYEKEFSLFREYFISLIAYDDTSFSDLNRIYNILCKELKIQSLLIYFENRFIEEIEISRREEKFIYEKYGKKNIKTSLDYLITNNMNLLDSNQKEVINKLFIEINSDNCDIESLYYSYKKIISDIWKKEVTNVNSYNQENDFCFICSNNQFIDEKHETILITKKMLERTDDYLDYQIGFICDYNDNVLYVTENSDIMTVEYNDMSNLKTPKQIEQEFINFKVLNKIALNGFVTKIIAVYYIDDGNVIKNNKAIELSNQYKLPLIVLKKDKI